MKLLNKVAVGLLSGLMAIGVGIGLVTAQTKLADATYQSDSPWSYTFKSGDVKTSAQSSKTLNNVSWAIDGTKYAGWDSSKGIQLGSGSNPQTTEWTMTAPISEFGDNIEITKISAYIATASSGGITYSFAVGSTSDGGTLGAQTSSKLVSVEFSNPVSSGDVVISLASTKSKAIYIKSLSVEFQEKSGSGDDDEITVTIDKINPTDTDYVIGDWEEGTLTFTSSSDSIFAEGYYAFWEADSDDIDFYESEGVEEYSESNPTMSVKYTTAAEAGSTITIELTIYNDSIDGFEVSDTKTFTVVATGDPTVSVTGVTLSTYSMNVPINEGPKQLVATVAPADATNKNVTWTSGDESIVTVDNTGLVTLVGVGTTTIIVTTEDGGYSATCSVTVKPAATEEPEAIQKTLSEVLDLCSGTDEEQTQAYIIRGTVTNIANTQYGNFTLTDGVASIYVYGACINTDALSWTGYNYQFTNIQDFKDSDVEVGKIITMKVIAYKYKSTSEISGIITKIEDGEQPSEEPTPITKTVSELLSCVVGSSTEQTQAYIVTGTISGVQQNGYGNFSITDETGMITVYGASETASALSWNGFTYTFTNPNNFDYANIKNGDTVTMKCIVYRYNTTIEISGVITNVEGGGGDVPPTPGPSLDGQKFLITATHTSGAFIFKAPDVAFTTKGNSSLYTEAYAGSSSYTEADAWLFTATGNKDEYTITSCNNSELYLNIINDNNGVQATSSSDVFTVIQNTETGTYTITDTSYSRRLAFYYDTNAAKHNWRSYTSSSGVQAIELVSIGQSTTTPVTGVSLDNSTASVSVGGTTKLEATVAPEDATNKNVTWSSADEAVATVNNNGTVTGVSEGTVNITVTTVDGGFTATCSVTVTAAQASSEETIDFKTINDISGTPSTDQMVWSKGIITITANKNGGTSVVNYYPGNGHEVTRLYKLNTLVFSVPSGYVITELDFTINSTNYGGLNALSAWDNATSVTGKSGSIVVEVDDAQTITATLTGTAHFFGVTVKYKQASGTTPAQEAAAWAKSFNEDLTCDNGVTAPNKTTWATLGEAYAELSADAKAIIKNATSSTEDEDIAAMIAKYDYIINKYGESEYSDFADRISSSNTNSFVSASDNAIYFVFAVGMLLVSSTGAVIFLKKKKEN